MSKVKLLIALVAAMSALSGFTNEDFVDPLTELFADSEYSIAVQEKAAEVALVRFE